MTQGHLPDWAASAFLAFNVLVLCYFLVTNASYLLLALLAFRSLRSYSRRLLSVRPSVFLRSHASPPVTLISPAYNEEATCVEAVRAFLALEYPEFEVVVVNDGSTDGTLARLTEEYELEPAPRFPVSSISTAPVRRVLRSRTHPNLWVLDKENGGKADALNAGLNHCRTPLFCAMDADSMLERDALTRLVRVFLEDVRVVAAGGVVRIANGAEVRDGRVRLVRLPRSLLARLQVLEYLRAFLAGRVGWDALDSTLVISGAFGMFRRSAVVDVGGFDRSTVGEDMELVVRLHRRLREAGEPYRIAFVPDPVAWTEAPESLRVLGRQRDRWQRGLMESLGRHVRMLFNPSYGRIGLVAFPYFFLVEMLGPILEVAGYAAFFVMVAAGVVSLPYLLVFLSLAVVLGIVLSVMAVGLDELAFRRHPLKRDLLGLFVLAVIENFGYRQLSTYWRFHGIVSKIRRVRSWGEMTRKGFRTAEEAGT